MAATVQSPPDPATSPWLHIAAPVGRVSTLFLIAQNFLYMFAPLLFLLDLTSQVDPGAPGGALMLLFSDPARLLAIADLVALIGIVVLACAVFLILFGLIRADKRVPVDAFLLGVVVLACLAAWVPTTAYAMSRARGATTVDAAAATGGWSLAAVLLLAASLAYLFFTIRLENGTRTLKLGSFKWPIYGAVNVLGAAAIAGFFQGATGGGGSLDAFTLGLTLKVTLIPLLGVMAYRDLRDRFPWWAHVPLHAAPAPSSVAARPAPVQAMMARPLPPPPDD